MGINKNNLINFDKDNLDFKYNIPISIFSLCLLSILNNKASNALTLVFPHCNAPSFVFIEVYFFALLQSEIVMRLTKDLARVAQRFMMHTHTNAPLYIVCVMHHKLIIVYSLNVTRQNKAKPVGYF